MSQESAPILLVEPLAWGIGTAEGQSFVTVDTGITLDGQTVYRLELQAAGSGVIDLILTDEGEVLVDDVTGNVLIDG